MYICTYIIHVDNEREDLPMNHVDFPDSYVVIYYTVLTTICRMIFQMRRKCLPSHRVAERISVMVNFPDDHRLRRRSWQRYAEMMK